MSQQKGLLSENELPEQIQKYFDLKLDKDALIKPTKDLVTEIYMRFLDRCLVNWMKPDQLGREKPVRHMIVKRMKYITQRFNVKYHTDLEFSLIDLIAPTRKRTTTLLNIVVFLAAELDELLELAQQYEASRAEQKKQDEEKAQQLSEKRRRIDDLAFKIGQSERINPIELEEFERILEAKKKECEEVSRLKDSSKARLTQSENKLELLVLKIRDVNAKIEESNARKESEMKISAVRKEIETREASLQKQKAENKAMRAKEEERLKHIESDGIECINQSKIYVESLLNEIKVVQSEKVQIKEKINEDIVMNEKAICMAKQYIEDFRKRLVSVKDENKRETLSILQKHKATQNMFVEVLDDFGQNDVPRNKSFIKSRNYD
jgi:hypothetical protein